MTSRLQNFGQERIGEQKSQEVTMGAGEGRWLLLAMVVVVDISIGDVEAIQAGRIAFQCRCI
jgi:hypothetical protein